MKYAVYVEGLSEMLFVADVLQKYSNYDPCKIGYKCITLNNDTFSYLNYPMQGDETSANYYQIVNVNNDDLVVSKLKKDIPNLIAQGFDVVLGLKDVYGELYKSLIKEQVVDRCVIEEMYAAQNAQLPRGTAYTRLHFSIMEYETWMLALIDKYIEKKGFSVELIEKQLNIDLHSDLEYSVYHPYNLIQKIYKLIGDSYHKHEGTYKSFLSSIQLEDYETLRRSDCCASFGKFLDSLLDNSNVELP